MKDKKFTYINEYYGKNFTAGMVVKALDYKGKLLYGNNYCHIECEDGETRAFHPRDVEEIK